MADDPIRMFDFEDANFHDHDKARLKICPLQMIGARAYPYGRCQPGECMWWVWETENRGRCGAVKLGV